MRCFYALILLLLAFTVEAQNKKLVIIGSSTSACSGPTIPANCYVNRLDAYYNGINHPVNADITALAVPGYNVYKGMPSSFSSPPLPGTEYQPDPNNNITKALSLNPDVILVNYPSNAFNVLTIGQIMYAFRTIRDSGVKAGVPVFITTSQPRQNPTDFDEFAERARLKEVRDSILAQFGTTAINFWDEVADPTTYEIIPTYNADNIHLNDAGHQILFENVRDANIFLATVLPVKLRSFNASQQQAQVNINWSVNDEVPGTRYEVQRSADGINYQTIYTATAGSAAASRSYNATDADAVSGIFYYRLKIVEQARSFYSQAVKLLLKNKLALRSFSVDPARKELVMKINAAETVRMQFNLVNSTGQIISRNTQLIQPGENRFAIPLTNMPAGTYWADAIADQQKIFTKGFRVY